MQARLTYIDILNIYLNNYMFSNFNIGKWFLFSLLFFVELVYV